MESVNLKVPVPVADAIRGEANRRMVRPGDVLIDFVRRHWPEYVAGELARDLRPAIDAVAVDEDGDGSPPAIERTAVR